MIKDIDISNYTHEVLPWYDGVERLIINSKTTYPSLVQFAAFMFFHNGNNGLFVYTTSKDISYWTVTGSVLTYDGNDDLHVVYTDSPDWKDVIHFYPLLKTSGSFPPINAHITGSQHPYFALDSFARSARSTFRDSIAVQVTNYRVDNFDINYPDYTLKDGYRDVFTALEDEGYMLLPHTNGLCWDDRHPDYDPVNMIWDESGAVVQYSDTLPNLKMLCLGVEYNERVILDAAKYLNTKGIYVDILNATKPTVCYNPNHAHPPGCRKTWIKGAQSLVDKLKQNHVVVVEGWSEACIENADGFLSVSTAREQCNIDIISHLYPITKLGFGMHGAYTEKDVLDRLERGKLFSAYPSYGFGATQLVDVKVFSGEYSVVQQQLKIC